MRINFFVCFLVIASTAFAQEKHLGDWYGELSLMGRKLPLTFHFYKDSALMDSPEQNSYNNKANAYMVEQDTMHLAWSAMGAEYNASQITQDTIIGSFKQMGRSMELNFSRNKIRSTVYKRPQTPRPPYSYDTTALKFSSLDSSFKLAGTLIDVNKELAVIFASGSGPQNRNSKILKHHPFWVISDHLAKNNISSLRFDDRGVAESGGNHGEATSEDFANDLIAAIKFLKEKGFQKVGVIGHSEGGMTAPMAAEKSEEVDFLVLMAPPGVSGHNIILKQRRLVSQERGTSKKTIDREIEEVKRIHSAIIQGGDFYKDSLKAELRAIYDEAKESGQELPKKSTWMMQNFMIYGSGWYKFFIEYDPIPTFQKLSIPVFVIQGGKDLQVASEQNIPPIRKALDEAPTQNHEIVQIENLNHLLQPSETGAPKNYVNIETTIDPQVLDLIANWVKKISK